MGKKSNMNSITQLENERAINLINSLANLSSGVQLDAKTPLFVNKSMDNAKKLRENFRVICLVSDSFQTNEIRKEISSQIVNSFDLSVLNLSEILKTNLSHKKAIEDCLVSKRLVDTEIVIDLLKENLLLLLKNTTNNNNNNNNEFVAKLDKNGNPIKRVVLIDGFPRTINQFESFEKGITKIDFVIYLKKHHEKQEKEEKKRPTTVGYQHINQPTINNKKQLCFLSRHRK